MGEPGCSRVVRGWRMEHYRSYYAVESYLEGVCALENSKARRLGLVFGFFGGKYCRYFGAVVLVCLFRAKGFIERYQQYSEGR